MTRFPQIVEIAVVCYFLVANLLYTLFAYLGLRGAVVVNKRRVSNIALQDYLERDVYRPVSILVPAYNEESSIVGSVRSFLDLRFPEFEIIVVCDGPTDGTLERLIAVYGLVEDHRLWRRAIETKPVRTIFTSAEHPNLVVVDKANGGKADALNVGLNLASYPIVAAVDADSLLDAEAVLRATRMFIEDDTLVAVGGTVRALNGATIEGGRVTEVKVPGSWIERFQILEYARAFFAGRAGWSHLDSLLIISGAFGLFKRQAVLDVGGYSTSTITEDMELIVRLHKHFRKSRTPYRIRFIPDPVCWTEVPSDLATLKRQRNRWHRGLIETLWKHRDMLFNPRYGRLGMVAVPYFWLFEALAPVIEVLGYAALVLGLAFGVLPSSFALAFVLLAVVYGVLLSQIAMGIETFLLSRYGRIQDRLLLLLTAFLESFGYRQVLVFVAFKATFQVGGKKGEWGAMKRKGIPEETRSLPVAAVDLAGGP